MTQKLILGIGLYCLILSGCADNTPPTLDLPSMFDLDVQGQSNDASVTQPDDALPDTSPPADQAFIPSSNPIPTRVETSLNVLAINAGQQAQVQCTVFDNQGMIMENAATQIDLRPAAGIQFESTDMGSELFAWSKDIRIDAKEAKNLVRDIYGPMGDKKSIDEAITEIMQSSSVKVCN